MDTELFDLCKQVYEKTGWRDTFAVYEQTDGIPLGTPYVAYPELEKRYGLWSTQEMKKQTPLYTSDYLLEKLPGLIGAYQSKWVQCLRLAKNEKHGYLAGYIGTDLVWTHSNQSDTPLKALLRLTLALSEAGEL